MSWCLKRHRRTAAIALNACLKISSLRAIHGRLSGRMFRKPCALFTSTNFRHQNESAFIWFGMRGRNVKSTVSVHRKHTRMLPMEHVDAQCPARSNPATDSQSSASARFQIPHRIDGWMEKNILRKANMKTMMKSMIAGAVALGVVALGTSQAQAWPVAPVVVGSVVVGAAIATVVTPHYVYAAPTT